MYKAYNANIKIIMTIASVRDFVCVCETYAHRAHVLEHRTIPQYEVSKSSAFFQ